MEPRYIKGYYYDEERKKYFKILPHHKAPEGAKYTQANIKQEEEERRKRKRQDDFEKAVSVERVHRSRLLQSPSAFGVSLLRETGQDRQQDALRNAQVKAYGYGLERHVLASFLSDDAPTDFVNHPTFNGIIVSATQRRNRHQTGVSVIRFHSSPDSSASWRFSQNFVHFTEGASSSINLTPKKNLIITTKQSNIAAAGGIVFIQPEVNRDGFNYRTGRGVSVSFSGAQSTSALCSASNPWTNNAQELIAVGTEGAVQLYWAEQANLNCFHSVQSPTDVQAVEWLSPSLVAYGLRNRSLNLLDARSRGNVFKLRHGGGIFGIRRVNEYYTMVAGIDHSMSLYDMRMVRDVQPDPGPRDPASEASFGRMPKQRRNQKLKSSKAVLNFDYRNEYRFDVGFDVCPEAGLVMAAEPPVGSYGGAYKLWSLQTGEMIWQKPTNLSHAKNNSVLTNSKLRFYEQQGGPWSIRAIEGLELVDYSW